MSKILFLFEDTLVELVFFFNLVNFSKTKYQPDHEKNNY